MCVGVCGSGGVFLGEGVESPTLNIVCLSMCVSVFNINCNSNYNVKQDCTWWLRQLNVSGASEQGI